MDRRLAVLAVLVLLGSPLMSHGRVARHSVVNHGVTSHNNDEQPAPSASPSAEANPSPSAEENRVLPHLPRYPRRRPARAMRAVSQPFGESESLRKLLVGESECLCQLLGKPFGPWRAAHTAPAPRPAARTTRTPRRASRRQPVRKTTRALQGAIRHRRLRRKATATITTPAPTMSAPTGAACTRRKIATTTTPAPSILRRDGSVPAHAEELRRR